MKEPLKPWKQLSTEYLHRENWFSLRRDRVLKGGGGEMYPYYVLEYSTWASIFPVTSSGKIIMMKQYRYGLGEFSLELPGGIMDPHETEVSVAAKRELREETGYTCVEIREIAKVAPNPATSNNYMHVFFATGCEETHTQDFDPHEELELIFMEVEEVKTLLRENKIIQSLHVSALFYGLMAMDELKF